MGNRARLRPRSPEPLGFCGALIEIGSVFQKRASGLASRVVGGAVAAAGPDGTRQKLLLFVSSAEELSCSGV